MGDDFFHKVSDSVSKKVKKEIGSPLKSLKNMSVVKTLKDEVKPLFSK